jgi:hemolysin D
MPTPNDYAALANIAGYLRDGTQGLPDAPVVPSGWVLIAADNNEQDRQSRQPTYVAHVALAGTGVATEQGFTPLEPGMVVTAEIKTGQRRLISYLLSPLLRYKQEGLRER